jgi:hypothetical protein
VSVVADLAPQLVDGQTASAYQIEPEFISWRVVRSDGYSHVERIDLPLGLVTETRRPVPDELLALTLRHFGLDGVLPWTVTETPISAPVELASCVYFIAEWPPPGFIKIGTAQCAASRLSNLQTASPRELRLFATVPGGRDVEAEMHERFAAERVRGEWFEPSERLLAFIKEIQS